MGHLQLALQPDGETVTAALIRRAYPWVTRLALFVVFFWFGMVKVFGVSDATGLAKALTAKTVGLAHFTVLFKSLAIVECVIGVLCLVPRATRLLIPAVLVHVCVVSAPLVMVPDRTWQTFLLVPTMDGQYIIKNVLIIAAVWGLAAHGGSATQPRVSRSLEVVAQPAGQRDRVLDTAQLSR
jgi:uncharacterized membrane protein YphA (DoxX/SURF4 family)